jgi:hypothetical protein
MKSSELKQADQVLMYHTPAWWIAEFRGPIGEQMRAMAGSDTVQTGFNGHIPAAVVCQAIAMLNPGADVGVAESVATAATRPVPPAPSPEPVAPAARKPQASASMLDIAADVIGTFKSAAAAPAATPKAPEGSRTVERALKIKQRFGLLVACSYLREQGWTFDAARGILLQALPKKPEACV